METYYGHVRTPANAIILFEACRIGLLPRVQRRLSEKERQSIRSGSVFVWDEREAGMRRWTDGKSWSASRVSGSFLTYREMEGKRGGGHVAPSVARNNKTPESGKGHSDEDHGDGGEEGPDGYRYKPDGLMKQSFSITTSAGQHLHLISYYARAHPTAPGLNQPSSDPALRNIRPQKGLYPESSINDQQNLPVVTRGPMAGAAYSVPPPAMGAYARAGPPPHPPPPHAYNPPYAWASHSLAGPPPPPPFSAVPYGGSHLPPPIAEGGHPALAYGHYPHVSPPHHAVTYDHRYPQHMEASVPPHPHSQHGVPAYGPSRSPHRHPSVAPQNGPPPAYAPISQPSQIDPRHAPPQADVHGRQAPNSTQGGEHLPSIAPHLAKAPSDQYQPQNGPKENSSSATVVPSINALMNGPPPPQGAPSNPTEGPRPAGTSQNGVGTNGETGGSQPGAAADGPQDIPNEKIGFGEDVRALRQLDRVFSA